MPRPRDKSRRSAFRGARAWLLAALLLCAPGARAESDWLVLGTHDAALASALSVAVSPRGLSVVELSEPLRGLDDRETALRELAVPGTVAVVWLCDDGAAAHALCFCGGDRRLVVKPLSVAAPLDAPDAAAVALSVKMLLGAPSPPPAPPPPARPAAPPPPREVVAPVAPPVALPWLAVELDAGARLQPPSAQHVGLRVGLATVLAPAAWGHALGVGVALSTGPALAAGGAAPAGRTLDDAAVEAFARGRWPLAPLWLEVDVGPALHFLSVDAGAGAPSRDDLSLDARVGAVMPLGAALVGVRAGGFAVVTSPATGNVAPVELPRWNGELALTLGFALR